MVRYAVDLGKPCAIALYAPYFFDLITFIDGALRFFHLITGKIESDSVETYTLMVVKLHPIV